jgi:hypothetical protein
MSDWIDDRRVLSTSASWARCPEIDRVALGIVSQRLLPQIDVDPARQGEGDDERRGHQIVRPHVGVDPAFEVAVAGQDRAGHQLPPLNRIGDLDRKRARVADAGGAAIAHEIEAQLLQIGGEPARS